MTNIFSGVAFGQLRIPFLSVQHKAVMDPSAWTMFSVRERYSPIPERALQKYALICHRGTLSNREGEDSIDHSREKIWLREFTACLRRTCFRS